LDIHIWKVAVKYCSLCKKTNLSSRVELKIHLVDYHTKESLAELSDRELEKWVRESFMDKKGLIRQ
jgi:hypothetical protein